jgi:two-component system, cell cycle response regulator
MLQRTLIVDDSIPLHKLIKTHLDGAGLEFYSAYDGPAALALAGDVRPRLILLDVDMPGMDGFEVCRRLKTNVETTTIPIIFLTADFHANDKVMGLDLGAVDYVTKPFKPEELCARVRAALRARQLLEQKAMIDGLTGLWNRKYLEDHTEAQLSLASRAGWPLACIALDVDNLRQINRKHGIPFGDEILRSIGSILLQQCRAQDAISRYEGGKFGIVVSDMSRSGAGHLAERLREQIQSQLLSRAGKQVGTTCSFGVADSLVTSGSSLLQRAEEALIRAKQNGGNCVSVARRQRKGLAAAA